VTVVTLVSHGLVATRERDTRDQKIILKFVLRSRNILVAHHEFVLVRFASATHVHVAEFLKVCATVVTSEGCDVEAVCCFNVI
jgi:hypothetical protein